MKNLITPLLVFFAYSVQAANYYFSSVSGDDSRTAVQAKSPSSPWKSLSKLNAFFSTLQPGDSVLFKRGETFYGSLTISRSGAAGSPIVIGAYGTGNRPVITGLTTLTNWLGIGNGIYESYNPLLGSEVNIVLLNDVQKGIGRYPNSDAPNKGYLMLESHSGSTSITDNELPSAPNWNGAEVVIRTNHWTMDKSKITSHSGHTISYTSSSGISARNDYGYFIQNHIKTLDQTGEWCYNASTKKISMFFGAASPSSSAIKAATIIDLIYSSGKSYITFDNLTLKGSVEKGFDINSGTNIIVKNCDVLYSGQDGVKASGTNFLLENSLVLNSANNGVNVSGATAPVIRNNIVRNTYFIAGMGQSGNGQGAGIRNGKNGIVEYNQVFNSGFVGVQLGGDNSIVRNNYIDTFCFIKDDAGGIYTSNSLNGTNTGRKVISNIILNGLAAREGTDAAFLTPAEAMGISSSSGLYMDDNTNGVEITGNTVVYSGRGILLHNSRQIIVKNNTFFNNRDEQLYMKYDGLGDPLRNHTITNNIFFAHLSAQLASSINTKVDDIGSIGRLDSNYYAKPINDKKFILNIKYLGTSSQTKYYYDLEGWKSAYNKDASSKFCAKKFAPYKVNSLTSSNKCGYGSFSSSTDIKIIRANSCALSWANAGALDGGYLKSVPSAASSSMSLSIGAISASKKYILRFSVKGTGSMNIDGFLRDDVYNPITSTITRTVSTARSENEMLFTPSSNQSNAYIVFRVNAQSTYYLDNIQLYEADIAVTNPDDSTKFVYNASQVNQTISLNGNYVDVKNNKFSNSIVLKPYTSAVLIKDGGTQPASANAAPSVSITSPVANTIFAAPASVTISATAADTDGKVSKVEFYNGSTLLGADTASPYTFVWNNVAAGNYTITAKATDNGSLATTSAAVAISVSASNAAPSVSFTGIATNINFAGPASVTLSAAAADTDGVVSKVEFYNADTLIGTVTASPYSFTWNDVVPGSYAFRVKATDDKGAVTSSSKVTISVEAPIVSQKFSHNIGPADTKAETLSKVNASLNLKLFPNPASSAVFVSGTGLPENKDLIISVISMNGMVIKTVRANTSDKAVEVNIASLTRGVYTIKAAAGSITINKQFVKQ